MDRATQFPIHHIKQGNSYRTNRTWRLLVRYFMPVVAVLGIVAVGFGLDRQNSKDQTSIIGSLPVAAFGPATFDAALTEANNQVELGREKLGRSARDWSNHETLAQGLMARARLTGDYQDWAEAKQLLATGMENAPKHSGPVIAQATLALSTHRLDVAAENLAALKESAVPPDQKQLAGIAGMDGDIHFYRGDMPAAMRSYGLSEKLNPSFATDFRLANIYTAQGRFTDSDAAVTRAVRDHRKHSPFMLAQAALRLGAQAMAQGKWEDAEIWFASADQAFPGYWLIAAHRVQFRALRGDQNAATAMAAIAERSGSAEVMDAAAMMFRQNGNITESRRWAARASALWQERLTLLPEAAFGHAVEHELAFGDPAVALKLAERNHAQRPYGDAMLLLANALIMNNRPQEALAQIMRAETSGWRSAPLYAAKAEAAALLGKSEVSQIARDEALAINPRIFDQHTSMIWFSHG